MNNFGAILEFGENGRLYRNLEEFKSLLTLNFTVTVISVLVLLIFGYFLWQFWKRSGEKYFNKPLLITTTSIIILSMLVWILNFVFYYFAKNIFGSPKMAQDIIITFITLGFVLIFSAMILLWFKIPYYGIAIDETSIWFLGENLAFAKITKIIEDDKTHALYINYASSHRLFKYYRISANSKASQFLRANLPKDFSIETGNQMEYFKELSKNLPSEEQ